MAKRKSTIQQVEAHRQFRVSTQSRLNIKYVNGEYDVLVDSQYIGSFTTLLAAKTAADEHLTRLAVLENMEAMTQAAQMAALVDDGDTLAAIHTYSVTQDVPALKAEINKLIASNTLVDTAERYCQYIRNVNGVVRLTSFIVRNWQAIANEEVGIPF